MPDKPILIRSTHLFAFRSGEWARLVGVERIGNRPCYLVEFLDGDDDEWAINDPAAGYEFR
jgi:hypothetical protein